MKYVRRIFSMFIFCVFLFVLGCMGPDSRHTVANASGELSESQKFTLNGLKNESISLDAVLKQNKAVLVNFWATWCPPCREEIPGLIDLQKNFGGKSFTVLGVDVGESQTKVLNFATKIGINYPVALDSDMTVAEHYSVVGIPTSLLISSDGKILGEYHAYTPKLKADVEKALE